MNTYRNIQQYIIKILGMQGQNKQSTAQPKTVQKAIKVQNRGSKVIYYYDKRVKFVVDPIYQINQIIGRGAYGVVAEGENLQNGQKVAVKLITQLFRNPEEAKRELRQIKILKFLKHKNIVSLLDIMKIQDKDTFQEIYLVQEFMEYNLRKLIQSKTPITEPMIKFILFQILDGLHHMHSADIIHRDIKPENILVNKKLQLKIADMNLARKEDDNPTEYVVTRPYRALEVFLCSKSYNKSIDIWSVGCIFAELIGRTVLFQGKNCLDQLKRFVAILGKPNMEHYENIDPIMRQSFLQILCEIPDRSKIHWKTLFNASAQALDLLDHMLEYDPKTRYSAEECLNHPFLRELRQRHQPTKCSSPFDFSFDDVPRETQAIRKVIYKQVSEFHPEVCLEESEKRDRPTEKRDRPTGEPKEYNCQQQSEEQGKPRKMQKQNPSPNNPSPVPECSTSTSQKTQTQ